MQRLKESPPPTTHHQPNGTIAVGISKTGHSNGVMSILVPRTSRCATRVLHRSSRARGHLYLSLVAQKALRAPRGCYPRIPCPTPSSFVTPGPNIRMRATRCRASYARPPAPPCPPGLDLRARHVAATARPMHDRHVLRAPWPGPPCAVDWWPGWLTPSHVAVFPCVSHPVRAP